MSFAPLVRRSCLLPRQRFAHIVSGPLYRTPRSPPASSYSSRSTGRKQHTDHVDSQHSNLFAHSLPPYSVTGLSPPILHGLNTAFPHVHKLFPYQVALLQAFESSDVLLKGKPGGGKYVYPPSIPSLYSLFRPISRSFGIALGVLHQSFSRLPSLGFNVSTLVIVPHRDLAAQYHFWLTQILEGSKDVSASDTKKEHPYALMDSSNILLLARGYSDPSMLQAFLDRKEHPRIVIATAEAFVEAFGGDVTHEKLHGLFSCIVVDELDALVDYVPTNASQADRIKAAKKEYRHPSAATRILNAIFTAHVEQGKQSRQRERTKVPQLIVCSATVRGGLYQKLFERQWLQPQRPLERIRVPADVERELSNRVEEEEDEDMLETEAVRGVSAVKQKTVTHYALVVGADGQIRNHPRAVPSEEGAASAEEDAEEGGAMSDEERERLVDRLLEETNDAILGAGGILDVQDDTDEARLKSALPSFSCLWHCT
jgi:hypothetical protein